MCNIYYILWNKLCGFNDSNVKYVYHLADFVKWILWLQSMSMQDMHNIYHSLWNKLCGFNHFNVKYA
jgi:hypothetical protein